MCIFCGGGLRMAGKRKSEAGTSSEPKRQRAKKLPPGDGWVQHPEFLDFYGHPDGKVWSSVAGRIVRGWKDDGVVRVQFGNAKRVIHQFLLECKLGRTIKSTHLAVHVNVADGSELDNSWKNLHEMSKTEYMKLHPKRKQTLKPPPPNEGWVEHPVHKNYYSCPGGKVWSALSGQEMPGYSENGYIRVRINSTLMQRHRFNLECKLQRTIKEGYQVDHIIPHNCLPDDSWNNLQELSPADHAKKTANDNPESDRRGVALAIAVIVKNSQTGEVQSFPSLMEAGRSLGVTSYHVQNSRDFEVTRHPSYLNRQKDLPGEKWKPAVLNGKSPKGVLVSDKGRIQGKTGRRNFGALHHGYYMYMELPVHNIIAHTFLGASPLSEHTVDHINRESTDNRISNLRWANPREQTRNRSLSRAVLKVCTKSGNVLDRYETQTDAAFKNGGATGSGISAAIKRGSVSLGYKWMLDTK
jgi:5-methylcytosine-specific restriction endonuclease McrA